jgi:hypothetical protein
MFRASTACQRGRQGKPGHEQKRRRRQHCPHKLPGQFNGAKLFFACSHDRAARPGAVEAGKGWWPHQADAIAELICIRRMPDAG